MNHSAANGDHRTTVVEIIKDKNGVDQVLLRNPRGASAKVRSLKQNLFI